MLVWCSQRFWEIGVFLILILQIRMRNRIHSLTRSFIYFKNHPVLLRAYPILRAGHRELNQRPSGSAEGLTKVTHTVSCVQVFCFRPMALPPTPQLCTCARGGSCDVHISGVPVDTAGYAGSWLQREDGGVKMCRRVQNPRAGQDFERSPLRTQSGMLSTVLHSPPEFWFQRWGRTIFLN